MRKSSPFIALVVCLIAASAHAQTLQRPSRPYRGLFGGGTEQPDPNRTRQELTLLASVLGGYDDYLLPGQPTEVPDPAQVQSGYTSVSEARLNYFAGRTTRSFTAHGRAFSNSYSDLGVGPAFGAVLDLAAVTELGRRSSVRAGQSVGYEPSLVLGGWSGLQADPSFGVLPDIGVGSGLVSQRSRSLQSSANLAHRWTTRQTTTAGGMYSSRIYLDDLGFDTSTRTADLHHAWAFRRSLTLDASYRYSRASARDDLEGVRAPDDLEGVQRNVPQTDHAVEGGLSYNRRVSPTREVQLSGGLGATRVESRAGGDGAPLDYWTPSGHATVRFDLGRSWALAADYRRSIQRLQGLTTDSFATNAAVIRADGLLGRRLEAAVSTAFSSGRSGGGDAASTFDLYSGSAQLRYALGRTWALSMNYDYYHYQFEGRTGLPGGLPPQYDRNAVRIGLSIWLPLYGSVGGARERE